MSASRVGTDLMYVFCTESASPVVKSYSPELIVIPLLPELPVFEDVPLRRQEQMVERASGLLLPWVQRLTCLVVGPGLGDDPLANATAESAIRWAASLLTSQLSPGVRLPSQLMRAPYPLSSYVGRW
jgi:ATP-dependent NAD(P)H-hydrate dehydratase